MRRFLRVLTGLYVALLFLVPTGPRLVPREVPVVTRQPSPPVQDQILERVYAYLAPKLCGVAGRSIPASRARIVSEALVQEARRAGFDPFFIVAVIEVESRWNIDAVSPTGARGLMQLLPSTFISVSDHYTTSDPVENVRAGIAYLSVLYKGGQGFVRPESILRAYNGGPGTAMRYNEVARAKGDLSVFSVEVRDYPGKVMASYRRLVKMYGGDHKHLEKVWRKP